MFFWKDEYSIGQPIIDEQHKKLIDLANHAFLENEATIKHRDNSMERAKIKHILNELYDYTKKHFRDEEDYMEHIGYPELNAHRKIHEQIIEKMNATLKNAKDLKHLEIDIVRLVDEWVLRHIMDEDKKIGEFAATKKCEK